MRTSYGEVAKEGELKQKRQQHDKSDVLRFHLIGGRMNGTSEGTNQTGVSIGRQ